MAFYGLNIPAPCELDHSERRIGWTPSRTSCLPRDCTPPEPKHTIEDRTIPSYWLIFGCIRIPRFSRKRKQERRFTRTPTEFPSISAPSRASTIAGYFDNGRRGEHTVMRIFWTSDYEVPLKSSTTTYNIRQEFRLDSVQSNETVYYLAEEGRDLLEGD
ncbi:hypothetical protein BZA77DRAFT_355801 [Pyronema omphalodes]|nr:hypothetical protein BZA77DRAFT_355801 [Pyronema omphalodes]